MLAADPRCDVPAELDWLTGNAGAVRPVDCHAGSGPLALAVRGRSVSRSLPTRTVLDDDRGGEIRVVPFEEKPRPGGPRDRGHPLLKFISLAFPPSGRKGIWVARCARSGFQFSV